MYMQCICATDVHIRTCVDIAALKLMLNQLLSLRLVNKISHTIRKCQKMARQNTFEILLLDDAYMIGEH